MATFLLIIKVLASLSALYMCFSPSTSIYRIHKSQDTGTASIIPLVALWACNHMWMLYGYVNHSTFPLLVTYAVGDVLSVLFIAVYYRWSSEKSRVLKFSLLTLVINAIVAVYAVLGMKGVLGQSEYGLQMCVGVVAIASSILLYASPFSAISLVIQTKSSASIPITMVFVGVGNNALWIIYGLLIHDMLLVIPTVVSIMLGLVQVVLYVVYHPKRLQLDGAVPVSPVGGELVLTPTGKSALPFSAMVTPKASDPDELSGITIESPPFELAELARPNAPQ